MLSVVGIAGGLAVAPDATPGRPGGPGGRGGRGGPGGPGDFGLPLAQLNLTDSQRQQIRDLSRKRLEGGAQVQERLALARRVVELEKPAHTIFDVGFYWALFRVGEARLGFDTLIDLGSRALNLLPELVIGRHFVGASQLAHPIVRPSDKRMSLECLPPLTS